jgi:hypothetical protein
MGAKRRALTRMIDPARFEAGGVRYHISADR